MKARYVALIVAAVCASAVLVPVGVQAATGTLVNITDPIYSDRKARLGPRARCTSRPARAS